MAATYRFKTVMVTDEARESFTELRDRADIKEFGRVTDKELFDAIWSLVDPKDVVTFMREKKRVAKQNKERQKLEKLKQELESKLEQTDETIEADAATA